MLSISTIASAIADASISSDPAQLAAMIMELSKRNRSKSRQQVVEESIISPLATLNQNGLLEELQKTTSVGDLSTPDMEKYLKRAEVSSSDSDGSTSQSCLDILTLADSASSNKQTQQQLVPLENGTTHKNEEHSVMKEQAENKSCQVLAGKASKQTGATYVASPNPRSDAKRSAIPRPKSSSLPTATATAHPAKRSLGSGQSTSSTSFKSKPADLKSGLEKNKNDYRATPSTNKSVSESRIKMGTARPQVASSSTTSNRQSLKGDGSMSTPAFGPKTSPGLRSGGRSELSSLKTSPHKPKATGGRTDKPVINQARSPRSPKAAQSVSKEKIAAVDRQDSLPTTQEKFGILFLTCYTCHSAGFIVSMK